MKFKHLITACAASAIALMPVPALAQRQPPTPEQRLDRLEKQMGQLQRQVFPKGRPADTAGFSDEPAATQSSVMTLDQRLDALERQMTDILRLSEENGNRMRTLETGVGQLRSDEEQRISAIEQKMAAAAAAPSEADATVTQSAAPVQTAKAKSAPASKAGISTAAPATTADATGLANDPGEDAYTEGFHLWQDGKYDEAITTLKAFASAYPKHRRASWANNLIGRALLDKGEPRAAAAALLANYRNNPQGERAPDSLFYLGQALMKLGQPAQACKAYGELDAVYGAKVRPDLKKLETDAKSQAQCG